MTIKSSKFDDHIQFLRKSGAVDQQPDAPLIISGKGVVGEPDITCLLCTKIMVYEDGMHIFVSEFKRMHISCLANYKIEEEE